MFAAGTSKPARGKRHEGLSPLSSTGTQQGLFPVKSQTRLMQPSLNTYLQLRTSSIKVLAAIPEGPLGIYDFSV